ncbi:MAG: hypothetical protein AAGJ10_14420 [Bacteroidota bacterium]
MPIVFPPLPPDGLTEAEREQEALDREHDKRIMLEAAAVVARYELIEEMTQERMSLILWIYFASARDHSPPCDGLRSRQPWLYWRVDNHTLSLMSIFVGRGPGCLYDPIHVDLPEQARSNPVLAAVATGCAVLPTSTLRSVCAKKSSHTGFLGHQALATEKWQQELLAHWNHALSNLGFTANDDGSIRSGIVNGKYANILDFTMRRDAWAAFVETRYGLPDEY